MRALSVLLVTIALTALTAGISLAETVYIGDRLIVGIREIPEGSAPSIGTLKSDDAVELLEEGDTYHRVRMADGTEGYIKKQYLTRKRPKVLLIADLEKQLVRQKQVVAEMKASMSGSQSELQEKQAELQASLDELKAQLADRDKQLAAADKQLETTRKELEKAQQDLQSLQQAAADVVSIVKAREVLQKENERLTDELNTMREDSVYLLTTFYIKWFLAGAGVMLVGWLIGKSSRRKRRY
jgi:SH3 domain protein